VHSNARFFNSNCASIKHAVAFCEVELGGQPLVLAPQSSVNIAMSRRHVDSENVSARRRLPRNWTRLRIDSELRTSEALDVLHHAAVQFPDGRGRALTGQSEGNSAFSFSIDGHGIRGPCFIHYDGFTPHGNDVAIRIYTTDARNMRQDLHLYQEQPTAIYAAELGTNKFKFVQAPLAVHPPCAEYFLGLVVEVSGHRLLQTQLRQLLCRAASAF